MSHLRVQLSRVARRRALGLAPRRRRMPRQARPDGIRADWTRAIRDLWLEPTVRRVRAEVYPLLEQAVRADGAGAREDAGGRVNDAIHRLAREAVEAASPEGIARAARRYAQRTNDFQKEQLARQVRARVGADVFGSERGVDRAVAGFVDQNVALIRSLPTRYLDDVATYVQRGIRAGSTAAQIQEDLEDRVGVAEDRAKLIARDQVGKLYGQVNGARQQALGIERFTWRTVRDERVRDEHRALEGQVFRWDDPPEEEGIPGEAINCRCYGEPVFEDVEEEAA